MGLNQSSKTLLLLTSTVILIASNQVILNFPQFILTCTEFKIPNETVGYDTTFFGLLDLKQCIPMENQETFSQIVASLFFGGIIGGILFDLLNFYHLVKLKIGFLLCCALTLIGSFGTLISNSVWSLYINRFIIGLGAGGHLCLIPTFLDLIEEIDCSLMGYDYLVYNIGFPTGVFLCHFISLWLTDSFHWRWILLIEVIGCLLNLICVFSVMVETPKWYIVNNDIVESEVCLMKYISQNNLEESDDSIAQYCSRKIEQWQNELKEIEQEHTPREHTNFDYLHHLRSIPNFQLIGLIVIGSQCCNMNFINQYGVKTFNDILPNFSMEFNLILSSVYLLVSIILVTFKLYTQYDMDKSLRVLATSFIGSAVTLNGMAILFGKRSVTGFIISTVLFTIMTTLQINRYSIKFVFSFNHNMDKVEYTTSRRYSRICYWLGNIIISYLFPIIFDIVGNYSFILMSMVSFGLIIYLYVYYN